MKKAIITIGIIVLLINGLSAIKNNAESKVIDRAAVIEQVVNH